MRWKEAVSLALTPTTFSAAVAISLSRGSGVTLGEASIAFTLLVLAPMPPVLAVVRSGAFDVFVSERWLRTPLLLLAAASYGVGFLAFKLWGVEELEFAFLAYALVTLGMAVVNALHTKGSVHVAGVVGPSIILLLLGRAAGLALLALSPLVGLARLRLKAHTPSQILTGAAVALPLTPAAYLMAQAV